MTRSRVPWARIVASLVATACSLAVAVPFSWVFLTAVKSQRELTHNPLGIPASWHLDNFVVAWTKGHFGTYFLNSVYVAIPTVILVLLLSTLAAFSFSQMQFRGKEVLFLVFVAGLTIPLTILVIPLYYELLSLGIFETHWALILPLAAKILPFGIVLLRGFMEDLPAELLDAARIDGCSDLKLLRRVVVPLSSPAEASLGVFTFMWVWNHYVLPAVIIHRDRLRTLPAGFAYFIGMYVRDTPRLMAGAMIVMLPIMVTYVIFQRQLIKGITAGAFR